MKFSKHYTPDEARALLPLIRDWLDQLERLPRQLRACEAESAPLLAQGADVGGPSVSKWLRTLLHMQEVAMEFKRREIQIKDLERGLIDFPSFVGGKEVFLCWERGELDIEFWHDLDAGYAGRQPLD